MHPVIARRLNPLAARVERMSLRERVVLALCICVVTVYVCSIIADSAQRERMTWDQLAGTQQEELTRATQDLDALRSGRVPAGDPALIAQLAQIEQQMQSVDASLRASQQYLVSPETMSALLQDLLRRDTRLELVSLETLAVTPILQDASAPAADSSGPVVASAPVAQAAGTGMFRHGVRITVRGDYLNVLSWMQAVEKLPWQMYWGQFAMQVPETGKPVFSIAIYTLSLDRTWMKI